MTLLSNWIQSDALVAVGAFVVVLLLAALIAGVWRNHQSSCSHT